MKISEYNDMMAYLTRPPRSEQQEASGERVQLAAGGLLKVLKKVFPKRDLSEYADLIEQARKAGVPINTIKDLENFQKQVQEASGKIYESRKKYPGVEGEKSGLPIDENELSTEQLIEYRKDNPAGKGRFTNAEAIIARLENTIKAMNPDDEEYEYVTKTFPNFIKELKANPKLAENENVWNNLMSDLPEDQRFIKYEDGTVDFETKRPSHQFKLREDLDTDRLGIKTDRTLNAEGGRIGAPRKPITDREERIAQALYGKSFDEIESKDVRSKIRRGLYTEQSKAQGTNIERSERAKTRAKEFVKKFKKENKRLPSLKELTTQGKLDYYVAKKYVDEGVVDVLPRNTTKGLGTKAPVDEQLLILNKNEKIKNAIKKGEIPSLQEVANILNIDKSTAANRIGQLADTYSGLRSVEGIKDKSNKASLVNEKLKRKQYEIRKTYESQVQKSIGEPKSISSQRKQIQRSLGDVSDYAVDEPGGLTSSARLGSEPYGAFSQIIKGDVNNKLKFEFDAKKAKKEKNLQRAIESNDKKAIKAAEIDFNNLISEYENKLNKNRVGRDKIKLFKVKVDLDNPEKLAQKTIKNFDKLPENYKKSFIENAVKNKYAFEVPSDIKTTYQIRKDLENPKIRNKVLKKAGSGNLRLYSGFSPELGKLSYEVLKDVVKGVPTFAGATALTAATGGIDPTSAIDRTALGAELAFAPELVKQSARFGPVGQRISNLLLSPKMAMRAARLASPVGIATLGAEGAYQLYQALENEKARIAAMSPEERQQFEEEQTAAAYMGEAEGFAYGGRVELAMGGDPKDRKRKPLIPIDPNTPIDQSRRDFMEKGAGIGALGAAIATGLVKFGPEISKLKKIVGSLDVLPKNAPEWLLPLYKKIKSLGKESKVEPTKEGGTGYKVTDLKTEDGSYKIVENEKTGEVVISADTSAGVNEGPLDFIVRPRKITGVNSDGTPIVDPGEFKMVENRAVGRMTSPEDYELDIDEYVTDNLDDLGSDWHAVEEFAIGKTDKTLQAKKLEGKKFIEENPGEDVVNRQGEYDYMGDDSMMEDY